jgi:hypothetical protein
MKGKTMNNLQKITTFQEDIADIKDVTTKLFLVAGKILQGIQDKKKYKEAGYKTFAEAVEYELGMKKSTAYELIAAAKSYEILSAIADKNVNNCSQNLPTSESQLRPITKLLPAQQISIWQKVAKDKVPTAKEVQEAVNIELSKNVDSCSQDLPITSLEVPIVPIEDNSTIDMSKYITIEEHNRIVLEYEKACMIDIEKLMNRVSELESRLSFFEKDSINPTPEKSTLLPRETVFNFVKQHGNAIQCLALLSDYLTNERLYNLFVKVREDYKMTTPPPAWDLEIINATGILSF